MPSAPGSPRLRIRGPALRRALIAGARRVIADRDVLNKINVFPVPDGDTGSNLAFTLGSVLTGALSRARRGAGELMRRVGEDAIDGARGNSGAILAQFFTGVAESIGSRVAIEPEHMAGPSAPAPLSARQALAEPREGTILSVISAYSPMRLNRSTRDRRMPGAGSGAPSTDATTRAWPIRPNQLPVLTKAGVVDAGAQGFVDLLEGIGDFIQTAISTLKTLESEADADLEAAQAHRRSRRRYRSTAGAANA